MRRRLLAILTILIFSIQTCYGVVVTIIEKDISYSFTKTPGNRVTLNTDNSDIQDWNVKKGDVVLDENDSFIMPNKDVEIEAVYSPQTEFKLIINRYGVITTETKTANQSVTVSAGSNSSYTFNGWEASGISLTASELSSETITFIMPSNTVRLVTKYEDDNHILTVNPGGKTYSGIEATTRVIEAPSQVPYNVTYNYNYTGASTTTVTANRTFNKWTLSGSGSISSTTSAKIDYVYGSGNGTLTASYTTEALTLPTVTREGYTLLGWSTSSSATSTSNSPGGAYTPTGDVTLYAVWKVNTYTITFDGNGKTGGTMSNQSFTYGTAKNLSSNAYSKTGHTFKGWSTSKDGEVAYTNAQSYSATSNATLYAVWEPNTYTVTFNKNGGTGTMPNQTFTYGVSKALEPNLFTKTNYAFAGWATTSSGAVAYTDAQSYSATANATLYAKWVNSTYTVTFNPNGGLGTMANQTFTYGTAQNLTANAFTKEGHVFSGWSTTKNGAVAYTDSQSYTATANVTLYAVWTPATYTITFNSNGGTGEIANQTFTYGVPQSLTSNTFTRHWYNFIGWSTTANGTVEYTNASNYSATADVTLYAVWERMPTYSITVIQNEGGYINGLYGEGTEICERCGLTDHECESVNVFVESDNATVKERD